MLFVYLYVQMHPWKPEENFQVLPLCCHTMGSRVGAQVSKPGCKPLCILNHLSVLTAFQTQGGVCRDDSGLGSQVSGAL